MKSNRTRPSNAGESRRDFLKKTASAAAAASAGTLLAGCRTQSAAQSPPATGAPAASARPKTLWSGKVAPYAGRVIGANDRIVVGYIGTGSRGQDHIRVDHQNAEDCNITLGAVSDLYQKRLEQACQSAGLTAANAYRDHRRLLERKDIDAVVVATVDNWHAAVAIEALESGKHVFGEKPMARHLDEGFELYDTVKRTGKVFQLGSQFCSDPMYHQAAAWIRAGKIGSLVWAQGSYCRNNPKNSEWTYPVDSSANPANLDWDRWQGGAPKRAFAPERFFSWHKFYDYNSGILGNLLPHRLVPLLLATGNPEFPRRVCCTGTRKVSLDRDITDTTHLLAEFPSGLTIFAVGSTVNEQGVPEMIRGRKGTLYFSSGQNQVELKPERPFAEELEAEKFSSPLPLASDARHHKNFYDCIRSGKPPNAHIDLAIRAHTVIALAETAERLNLTLLFDPETRTIRTGDGRMVQPLSYETAVPPLT